MPAFLILGGIIKMSIEMEPLQKLTKDLKTASVTLNKKEIRYLVDLYYQMQEYRKATANQEKSMDKEVDPEPHEVLSWFKDKMNGFEKEIKKVMDIYTKNDTVGEWMQSITGIGPIISAGLISIIDISRCPTAGHIWSYAGMDPNREWLGKEKSKVLVNEILGDKKVITDDILHEVGRRSGWKYEYLNTKSTNDKGKRTKENLIKAVAFRPWNSSLKNLCWKLGQSFLKVKNNPKDVYGKLIDVRKAYEMAKNEKGDYADYAALMLSKKNYGKETEAYKSYILGKLPPAHINQRCCNYAVKIFLSHLHHVMYVDNFGMAPPKPFAEAILGHAHMIPIPNYSDGKVIKIEEVADL